MKKFIQTVAIFATISLLVSGCNLGPAQAESAEATTSNIAAYQIVLGKLLSDSIVIDFIADHNCSSAGPFRLCKDVGMALWIDASQIIETVYLYAGGADGFQRYRGKLPFGLSFYDPMWRVEEKLKVSDTSDTDGLIPITGKVELLYEASSPDHMHYWVVYRQLGLTVIYDTPGADEDAYIYAVLVKN